MTDNEIRIRKITLDNIESEIEREADMAAAFETVQNPPRLQFMSKAEGRRYTALLTARVERLEKEQAERDRIVAQTETYHKLQAILNPRRNSRKDW